MAGVEDSSWLRESASSRSSAAKEAAERTLGAAQRGPPPCPAPAAASRGAAGRPPIRRPAEGFRTASDCRRRCRCVRLPGWWARPAALLPRSWAGRTVHRGPRVGRCAAQQRTPAACAGGPAALCPARPACLQRGNSTKLRWWTSTIPCSLLGLRSQISLAASRAILAHTRSEIAMDVPHTVTHGASQRLTCPEGLRKENVAPSGRCW